MYGPISSSDEDSDDTILTNPRKKQKKVGERQWSNVTPQKVDNLPVAIDGLQVFIMKKISNEEQTSPQLLQDGRRWKKSCPTEWVGHWHIWFADCKGSHKCENDTCPYKIQYGVRNTTQFEKKKDRGLICKGCGMKPNFIECFARRYVSAMFKQTKVYHCGKHTCPVIKPANKNKLDVAKLVKSNPNIKPSEIQSSCILYSFREGADWQTVEKQVEATLDRKWISNLKYKLEKPAWSLLVMTSKRLSPSKDTAIRRTNFTFTR